MEQSIVKLLEELSLKLGGKAEEVYEAYLKETKLYKFIFFVELGTWLFIDFLCFALADHYSEGLNSLSDIGSFHTLIFIFAFIAFALFSVFTIVYLFSIPKLISSIVNPEYQAIKLILEDLKGE